MNTQTTQVHMGTIIIYHYCKDPVIQQPVYFMESMSIYTSICKHLSQDDLGRSTFDFMVRNCERFTLFLQSIITYPRNPVIFSDDDWGVQSPPKRIVFRFHYHSQKASQDA